MDMCPYCGEDAPIDSTQCWKCGSDLSGDALGDDGEHIAECPACTAPIPPSAPHCGECGWTARKHRPRRRVAPVTGAFVLVCLGISIGLGFGLVSRLIGDPARADTLAFSYEKLADIYGGEGGQSDELRALWDQHHHGRFVSWEMVVVEVFDDGTLALAPSPVQEDDGPFAVVLSLANPKSPGLKPGKAIKYSAALERYEGRTFFLTSGLVDTDA
jgi:predicted nucleic acid-binding Zn ribbon protein